MSNPDHRRPSIKSSQYGFIHDLTHRLLPTCFFLHFLITGSVFLVYAVNQQPAPRQYATGASVAFGTLCGLYVLVFLVDYFRRKLAKHFGLVLNPEDAASSTAGTPSDKGMSGQSGGFRNGLMKLCRDLMKKTCLLSEDDKDVSEKVRRRGRRERGQIGGHVPFDGHSLIVHDGMDGESNPYYRYEGTQSAYYRREQSPRSFGHHGDNNFQDVNLEAQNHQQTERGPLPRTDLPMINTICLEDQSPFASRAGPLPPLCDHDYRTGTRFPSCPESLKHIPSISSIFAFNFDSTNANASVDLERGTIPPTPRPHPRPPATHWLSRFGILNNWQRESQSSQYSEQTTGPPTPPLSVASTRSSLEVLPASTTRSAPQGAAMSMPTLPHPTHAPRPGNSEKPRTTVAFMKYYQDGDAVPFAMPASQVPSKGEAHSRRNAAAATARMQANTLRDKASKQTTRSNVPLKGRLNKGEEEARLRTAKWKKDAGRKVGVRVHSKMGPPRSMFEDEYEGVGMWEKEPRMMRAWV